MKVKVYGSRGSLPVCHPSQIRYGGNTTCIRVDSQCLPEGHWLACDAGTGMHPMFGEFMKAGGKALTIFQSHHHHDHTQGFPLTGFAHIPHIPVTIIGPEQDGMGPREVYEDKVLCRPVFPVPYDKIAKHIVSTPIVDAMGAIITVHPKGGVKVTTNEKHDKESSLRGQMSFVGGFKFPLAQCLVARLHETNHPEKAYSYRFDEWPTGKSMVFMTDHEDTAGLPATMLEHVNGADLLVIDCQYTQKDYEKKAGWGHGTPQGVARLAKAGKVRKVGLTHHDPSSSDEAVDAIVAETQKLLDGTGIEVFGCADYMTIEV